MGKLLPRETTPSRVPRLPQSANGHRYFYHLYTHPMFYHWLLLGNWITSTLNMFWYSPPLVRIKSSTCCCCNYSVSIILWTCDDLQGCHQTVAIKARFKSPLIIETSKIFTCWSLHKAITFPLQKGHLIWTCVSCFPGLGVGGDTI